MSTLPWVLVGIIAVIIIWLLAVYNSLVRGRIRTEEAWSDIEVQLKRRYNLIPNLVETVKGYASHEKGLFEKVTEARTRAMAATTIKEHGQAENILSTTLKSLFAVAENYPDLKANQNFLELQRELTDTEDKIQAARRFYNGVVRDFNTLVQIFPNSLVAGLFNFKSREFFELESEAEKEVVKVNF